MNKQPYVCPVCCGKRVVPNGFYSSFNYSFYSSNAAAEKCESCNGRGIVWCDYVQFEPPTTTGEMNDGQ